MLELVHVGPGQLVGQAWQRQHGSSCWALLDDVRAAKVVGEPHADLTEEPVGRRNGPDVRLSGDGKHVMCPGPALQGLTGVLGTDDAYLEGLDVVAVVGHGSVAAHSVGDVAEADGNEVDDLAHNVRGHGSVGGADDSHVAGWAGRVEQPVGAMAALTAFPPCRRRRWSVGVTASNAVSRSVAARGRRFSRRGWPALSNFSMLGVSTPVVAVARNRGLPSDGGSGRRGGGCSGPAVAGPLLLLLMLMLLFLIPLM